MLKVLVKSLPERYRHQLAVIPMMARWVLVLRLGISFSFTNKFISVRYNWIRPIMWSKAYLVVTRSTTHVMRWSLGFPSSLLLFAGLMVYELHICMWLWRPSILEGNKEDSVIGTNLWPSFWALAKRRRVGWWLQYVMLCNWWRRNIVAMASLSSLQWCCCHCCTVPFCPCCNGAVAIVAQSPLLLLCWCHCLCCTGIVAVVALALLPLLYWHCHIAALALSHCCVGVITHFDLLTGIVAVIAIVLLLLGRFLCLCCAGVVSLVMLALLPLLHWCCCPQCVGVVFVIVQVLPILLRWRLCHSCAGVIAIIAMAP